MPDKSETAVNPNIVRALETLKAFFIAGIKESWEAAIAAIQTKEQAQRDLERAVERADGMMTNLEQLVAFAGKAAVDLLPGWYELPTVHDFTSPLLTPIGMRGARLSARRELAKAEAVLASAPTAAPHSEPAVAGARKRKARRTNSSKRP